MFYVEVCVESVLPQFDVHKKPSQLKTIDLIITPLSMLVNKFQLLKCSNIFKQEPYHIISNLKISLRQVFKLILGFYDD